MDGMAFIIGIQATGATTVWTNSSTEALLTVLKWIHVPTEGTGIWRKSNMLMNMACHGIYGLALVQQTQMT
jgi:hypothetical protein